MTPEQELLLEKAKDGLGAATLLTKNGYNNSAVSETYYAMFHAAKALLLGKGLTHSRHSAVISAFGHEFTKTGIMPVEMHRWLIAAQEVRIEADYEASAAISPEEVAVQIRRAEEFLEKVRVVIDSS